MGVAVQQIIGLTRPMKMRWTHFYIEYHVKKYQTTTKANNNKKKQTTIAANALPIDEKYGCKLISTA